MVIHLAATAFRARATSRSAGRQRADGAGFSAAFQKPDVVRIGRDGAILLQRMYQIEIGRTGIFIPYTRRYGGQLVRALARRTPKDTGKAAQGWLLGQARFTWEAEVLKRKVLTVANSVPYIEILNEGHSNQAPKGYIEATIQDWEEDVLMGWRLSMLQTKRRLYSDITSALRRATSLSGYTIQIIYVKPVFGALSV